MEIKDISTVILGALTLAWTIWATIRASREKRYGERIDALLKIKGVVVGLGTAGLDGNVNEARREESQNTQLESVDVALRRVSATYVQLVHKAVPSYFAAIVLFAYSLVTGFYAYGLLRPAAGVDDRQQTIAQSAALVFAALFVGLVAACIIQLARARRARVLMKRAGIDLRGVKEKLNDAWNDVATQGSRLLQKRAPASEH